MTREETLEKALQEILNIKNKMYGADWQEIDEAREIASKALGVDMPDNVFEEEEDWIAQDYNEGISEYNPSLYTIHAVNDKPC